MNKKKTKFFYLFFSNGRTQASFTRKLRRPAQAPLASPRTFYLALRHLSSLKIIKTMTLTFTLTALFFFYSVETNRKLFALYFCAVFYQHRLLRLLLLLIGSHPNNLRQYWYIRQEHQSAAVHVCNSEAFETKWLDFAALPTDSTKRWKTARVSPMPASDQLSWKAQRARLSCWSRAGSSIRNSATWRLLIEMCAEGTRASHVLGS